MKPISFNYYWNLIGPIIDLLTDSEVVVTKEKLSRAASDTKMMSEADVEMFELNVYKTQLLAHQLIANIMKSRNSIPAPLREILFAIAKNTHDRFGKDARNYSLTTFLVLRFLAAILTSPRPYNILRENQEITEVVATTMSNLASITVKISSSKEFSDKDGKLAELNPFIRAHIPKFHQFYEEIMAIERVSNEPSACSVLPKNVKAVVIAEIQNAMINNKEKFLAIENEKLRAKIQQFLENAKPIQLTNKNFSFTQY